MNPTPVPTPAPSTPVAVTPESFAAWLQRTHPQDFLNALAAYQLAVGPFIAAGMSYEDAYAAAVSRQGPAPTRTDIGTPTSADQLKPLTGALLEVIHSANKNTDAYTAAVATMRQAGYSDQDIAGYIVAYNPGGKWYGQ